MSVLIAENVYQFLDLSTGNVMRALGDHWNQDVWGEIQNSEIESPIEQLFYIAVRAQCSAAGTAFNPLPFSPDNFPAGLYVYPQSPVGKYRVDFQLVYETAIDQKVVLVELDGHQFHDKNKKQRAYEKSRDRFLVRQGYKVLHFTGSEVVADPYRAAHEALSLIGFFYDGDEQYDPKDPLVLA